jgi:hypothetical protein
LLGHVSAADLQHIQGRSLMQWRVVLMADGKSSVRHVSAESAAAARETAVANFKKETGLDATVGHILRNRR